MAAPKAPKATTNFTLIFDILFRDLVRLKFESIGFIELTRALVLTIKMLL